MIILRYLWEKLGLDEVTFLFPFFSADFFPGKRKNFPRGGKNLLFALKTTKNEKFRNSIRLLIPNACITTILNVCSTAIPGYHGNDYNIIW